MSEDTHTLPWTLAPDGAIYIADGRIALYASATATCPRQGDYYECSGPAIQPRLRWTKGAAERVIASVNETEALRATVARLEAENGRLRRCLLPVWMTLAEQEMVGERVPDDARVLSFMGSGASDFVTAGDIRAARDPQP